MDMKTSALLANCIPAVIKNAIKNTLSVKKHNQIGSIFVCPIATCN